MASPAVNPSSDQSQSKSSNPSLHPRLNERNYYYYTNSSRNRSTKSIWRRIEQLDWNQCNPIRGYHKFLNYVLSHYSWRSFSARSSEQTSRFNNWFSSIRNNRYQQNHKYKRYHYLLVSLLTIGACAPAPVSADDDTYNTAAPESTATGNVTNQAVQFQNNGAPSRQQMGGYNGRGIACNGPTMTFSPFWLATENKPYDPESYSQGWNYGAQVNFMVPLDSSITEMCKTLAKRQNEKMRVDYELVRSLKCAELMTKGFTFRPGSRVEHMCSDIVPIVSLLKPTETTE